jgi:hypothetical protein
LPESSARHCAQVRKVGRALTESSAERGASARSIGVGSTLHKNLVIMYALTLFELFKPAGNNLHI